MQRKIVVEYRHITRASRELFLCPHCKQYFPVPRVALLMHTVNIYDHQAMCARPKIVTPDGSYVRKLSPLKPLPPPPLRVSAVITMGRKVAILHDYVLDMLAKGIVMRNGRSTTWFIRKEIVFGSELELWQKYEDESRRAGADLSMVR